MLSAHVLEVRSLVDRCCGGDAMAWEEFVDRYHERVTRLAYRAAGSLASSDADRREAARDLIQEVYLKLVARDFHALRAWRGESEESLVSYVASVVHGLACDELRRRRSRKRAVSLVPLDAPPGDDSLPLAERLSGPESGSPERQLIEWRSAERVGRLLAESCSGPNGPRNAIIFQLYHFEGMSAREIAELPCFRMTVPNVETILRRTRERVRELLGSGVDLTG
jgi:RNA polymerase sigma factor (sigma-70 family)